MRDPFTKTVRLGTVEIMRDAGVRRGHVPGACSVFCKIEFSADGRLSVSGVEGPLRNGDALGACGQIVMHLLEKPELITPAAPEWDAAGILRFLQCWDRWHLNDMRAACEHQRAAGWLDVAGEEVKLYYFRRTTEASKAHKAAEDRAIAALRAGETHTPSPADSRIASLPYSFTTHDPATAAPEYEPATSLHAGHRGPSEVKRLGWLREDEHPRGILSKACPACGYKYGSAWLREEVPADVLAYLRGLPDTDRAPTWI